jgi:uncharacterized protein DUF3857
MRNLVFTLSLLFIVGQSSLAQKSPMKFGKIPEADLAMTACGLDSSAAAMVLGDYGWLRFDFRTDDTRYVFSRHKRIKIFHRSGYEKGDVTLPFYSADQLQKMYGFKATVYNPDGSETDVGKKDFFIEKVNDHWSQVRFSCPNLQEGSVLEYKYELSSKYFFELPEWYFQDDIPVRYSELRLEIPEWYNYVFINQGRPLDVKESDAKFKDVYLQGNSKVKTRINYHRLAMQNVPALKEESYITTMSDYYARIRFQLQEVKYPNAIPRQVMSSWPKVAGDLLAMSSFGDQFMKKRNYDEAWEAARSVLADAKTAEEKIEALYYFLLTNVNCESRKGVFVRESLNACFAKKSACSGELNLLMVALLNEAGVEAYPALVSTRSNGSPMQMYPLLDQFNHVMAIALDGDNSYWLDLANPFRPTGYPAPDALNGQAWVVIKDNPQWVDLVPPAAKSTYFITCSLDEEGKMDGSLTMSAGGYSAVEERQGLQGTKEEAYFKKYITGYFPDAEVDSVAVENQFAPDKPLKVVAGCHLPDMAQVSGDFIYLAPAMMTAFDENPFKMETRSYPVDIPYPMSERIILNLTLPPGYVVEEMPESVRMSLPDKGASFQFQLSHKGNQVQMISTLKINKLRYEPEEYAGLRNFFSLVAEKFGEQLVLKKG